MQVLEKHTISHDPPVVIRSDRQVTVEQTVSLGREERVAVYISPPKDSEGKEERKHLTLYKRW